MRIRVLLPLLALAGCRGKPPELAVAAGNWFNASAAPTLASLEGRVVWLEFSFAT